MDPAIALFSAACVLGATSGLSPGPLLTLVVTESFRKGFRSGAAVAVAPLVTDAPVIFLMILLTGILSSLDPVIGWLYLAGACYLAYLSLEQFRFKGAGIETVPGASVSFRKGIVVNLLNPAPYVFWLTIGAPLLVQAREISWMVVMAFLAFFYGLLVGMKLLLAVLIGRNRHLLKGPYYRTVMLGMGVVLILFAVIFVKNGVEKIF
ncbi:MAG: LysE family translocator [Acidobacteria bacterium]|nr:LysE family translocator [Acidobacteriota bacterium]